MSDTAVKVAGTAFGVVICVAAGLMLNAPRVAAAAVVSPFLLALFELGWQQDPQRDAE